MKLKAKIFACIIILIVHSVLLSHYAFNTWLDCDEGQWAHVAERVANSEILHTEVKEHHPDYIHYVNAFSLKVFGHDFKSLRYPLIITSLIQSLIVFLLLADYSLMISLLGSLCISSFGFIQVLNPTPNLYALFIHILILAVVCLKSENKSKYLLIGFLLASEFLFRQLSAVYTGLAIYCCLQNNENNSRDFSKSIGWILLAGLTLHILSISNWSGRILFCIAPLIILKLSILNKRDFYQRSAQILFGFLIGLCPQLIDLIIKGNFISWTQDVFIQSTSEIANFKALHARHYLYDLLAGLNGILNIHSIDAKLNGIYLITLPIIPFIQSLRTLILWRELQKHRMAINIAIFASFFALVPAFNQVPLYLNTIVGLNLCSLILNEYLLKTKYSKASIGLSLYLCVIGLYAFAGQSTLRDLNQITKGARIQLIQSDLPNLSLNIEKSTYDLYSQLQNKVDQLSTKDDSIVALPFAPYLYFILNRKNPTPWIGLDYAKLGGIDHSDMLRTIEAKNPKLIIYCSNCCSYIDNDESDYESWLNTNYQRIEQIDKYQVFQKK